MSKENTVVSGRYFAGMWKCLLYPIICFAISFITIPFGIISEIVVTFALFLYVGGYRCAIILKMI